LAVLARVFLDAHVVFGVLIAQASAVFVHCHVSQFADLSGPVHSTHVVVRAEFVAANNYLLKTSSRRVSSATGACSGHGDATRTAVCWQETGYRRRCPRPPASRTSSESPGLRQRLACHRLLHDEFLTTHHHHRRHKTCIAPVT